MPESTYPMLPVADALALVLAQAEPLTPISANLVAAFGQILAADIFAGDPLPPFPASVKDGYAVVAADGPGDYPVVGAATAGHMPTFTVAPGTVAYITTGAPLPQGADAVVMVEETTPLPGDPPRVRIQSRVHPHADVRPVGFDVAAGALVLPAGTRLGPAEIGILATVGAGSVPVYPRPKVALLSTGDELVDPDQPLRPGQIRDSNRATLQAAVEAAGGQSVDLGIARDDPTDLEQRIHAGLATADVLVTSGGVSMGEFDYVKSLLEAAGTVHFGRLRMKPGKPLTFATVDVDGRRRLVFGLPGNPVSSLVTFYF